MKGMAEGERVMDSAEMNGAGSSDDLNRITLTLLSFILQQFDTL